jgi:hypothetical protein
MAPCCTCVCTPSRRALLRVGYGTEKLVSPHICHSDDRAHLADVLQVEYEAGFAIQRIAERWGMATATVLQLLVEAEEVQEVGLLHQPNGRH